MKDFISELLYMCSASNTKSRGLYIFITSALVILTLGFIASVVLMVLNIVLYGAFKILFLILALVTLAVDIGMIIWLKKS